MDYKEKRKSIIEMRESKEELNMQSAISMFLSSRKLKNLTENTVASYSQSLNKLSTFLANNEIIKVNEIIVEDIQEFIQTRKEKGNSAPTLNKYIRNLRAFFNFLRSSGYLLENPMEPIDKLVEEKRILRTLSREQITLLLDVPDRATPAGYRNYVFILLILDTGLRIEEALTFNVEDVYWKEQVIQVFGKGRKERLVPFSATLAVHLREYLELRGETDTSVFFVNIDGLPLKRRTVQEEISDYGQLAKIKGVRVSCHSLRYTFARNYILNGGDIVSLMKILGHKSLHMAQLYSEMFQGDVSKQHSKFSPVSSLFN
ncbi:tyrosine-type recombinase/integrase [Paenibacillus sp. UASWS1643]|uniref:tyrosine-type recombinase/integrase n=1 Tax=Paenibacillus sp. UASWS1643 TaxID=2580422 RepID=UPI001239E322|nr:tyrosine-type recombinase/integrase [Paenibacillus sp. UASWS1643]KAA8756540.1 tyrosine-type recombinase/integrase [Paenibacillus sp. UASWS1643]